MDPIIPIFIVIGRNSYDRLNNIVKILLINFRLDEERILIHNCLILVGKHSSPLHQYTDLDT